MDLEVPASAGRKMRWPTTEGDCPAWLQFRAHNHEHSTPDHHYYGDTTCDRACRQGRRLHRHKVTRGMRELTSQQIRPTEYRELVEERPSDLALVLPQADAEGLMPEDEGH